MMNGHSAKGPIRHDDQHGPYCDYYPTDAFGASDRGFLMEYVDQVPNNRKQRVLEPLYAIAPIYGKVRNSFLDIQRNVAELSGMLKKMLGTDVGLFEWDIRLALSNEFKSFMRVHVSDVLEYRGLLESSLPRFLWVMRLLLAHQVDWEILQDATDTPRSVPVIKSVWLSTIVKHKLTQSLADMTAKNISLSSEKARLALVKWFIGESEAMT